MIITTVKTANNGGCGECACHCHSDEERIPPGHIATCKFADPDYVPPDFKRAVRRATDHLEDGLQHEFDQLVRENEHGPS